VRLLTVHPGAQTSTQDVYDGLAGALAAAGHEIDVFPLDTRISRASSWLMHSYRRVHREHPEIPKPNWADALYTASKDVVLQALRARIEGRIDGVLIISGMYLHPDILIMLRAIGVRTAMLLTESPYDQESEAKAAQWVDVAWTNERTSVAYLRATSGNPNIHYLPHAYDPARHSPQPTWLDEFAPAHDVVFVGTAFKERVEALSAVDWTGIDLGLYGSWEALGSRHPLRQYIRGKTVSNAQASALYRRAKIGLNLYRTSKGFSWDAPRVTDAESLNPRALELAACGVFQTSDWRAEVEEVFGAAVPTFRQPTELELLIRTWLAKAEQRPIFAEMARRCARPHTFDERAEQVVKDLERAWSRPLAAAA
jgi:spore maturation protein CgeB